jgi:hypothetical protein
MSNQLLLTYQDDCHDSAIEIIKSDPNNSIHEALDFDNLDASKRIIKSWLGNNPEQAGKVLFELLDLQLAEVQEITFQGKNYGA